MKNERPDAAEYDAYYERYVSLVPEVDVLDALERQAAEFDAVLAALGDEQAGFRYAPGKWTVRELVGHVLDTERVFGYRALAIARGDRSALPGFDENTYSSHAGHDRYPLADLVAEFRAVRAGHVSLLRHLDDEAWARTGIANESRISVRALAYLMAGHARHHLGVLRDRYRVAAGA